MYACLFVCTYTYMYVFMAEALAYSVIKNNHLYHKFVTRLCILPDFFDSYMYVCLYVYLFACIHLCMYV